MSWAGTDAAHLISDPDVARRLADAVERCEKLPVLDKALQRVLALADLEETSVAELVEALEQDPGLAANVLRFANSAANPVRMPIATVRQAVTMVGRTGVRRLALDAVAYRFFERAAGNGSASSGQMHLHALQVSRLAVACAGFAGIGGDAAHLAGLLHDCGKLVLPLAFGEEALDAISAEHPDGSARIIAEQDRLGTDHARAGALLAAASGVDAEIVRAIAWHHGGDDHSVCPDRITACVQLADQVAASVAGQRLDPVLCRAALITLGLPDETLDDLAAELTGGPLENAEGSLAERVRHADEDGDQDDLTGLASRRHWLQTVRDSLDHGRAGGLVVVDVDALGAINDAHGRALGDGVLCRIAALAEGMGFAGRLGDDELAIWIADEPTRADDTAEQIVRSVRRGLGPESTPMTVSAGCASTLGGDDLEVVLALARGALARAKREGRDRAVDGDLLGANR